METKGIIFLAQIDHLSGEEIAWALEVLQSSAIYNSHLIPTLTKKGRPGYILLLDVHPDRQAEVGLFLFQRLGIRGYHRLETSHIFEETTSKEMMITVRRGGDCVQTRVRVKYAENQLIECASIESDDLIRLHDQVRDKLGVDTSFLEFKRQINMLLREVRGDHLEVQLGEDKYK